MSEKQPRQVRIFNPKTTLNCRGRLVDLQHPVVMGIVNLTPDSFYDGGQLSSLEQAVDQAGQMLKDGATILDLGAASSRPGAPTISPTEENDRLLPSLTAIAKAFPNAFISVDTWRATVAEAAVEAGADMINDISGGDLDADMWPTVARLNVPYMLMHMQGTPDTMQKAPQYTQVVQEVWSALANKVDRLHQLGIHDLVIDPGFGFGKTVEHNYQLLAHLEEFQAIGHPILVGFSRKSMVNRVLGTTAKTALNGTTALNMVGLMNGASILRVHDVREAMETVRLYTALAEPASTRDL